MAQFGYFPTLNPFLRGITVRVLAIYQDPATEMVRRRRQRQRQRGAPLMNAVN